MLWVGRLFEERYTFVRITLVSLSGVGFLTLMPDHIEFSTADWFYAIGAIVFGYVGIYSPFAVVSGLALAIALAPIAGSGNDVVPSVALSYAMLELAVRGAPWEVWTGAATGALGTFLGDLPEMGSHPFAVIYGALLDVGVMGLVGLYIRATRELAVQAAARARQEMTRVRAEERGNIARELHDLVAHHVASIVLRVAVARNVLPLADPRMREVLDDVHATGSSALADLRRLVSVLRDPNTVQQTPFVDPSGLPIALESAVDRSRQIGLAVTTEIDPEIVKLDARAAHAVLRLTQEGLANVAKHAGTSSRARLSIVTGDEATTFQLQDDGGLPATAARADEGHGLTGLRERIEVLGGRLEAGPAGTGWLLKAVIPAC